MQLAFLNVLGVLLLGAGVAWAEDEALVVTDDVTIPEEGAAYSSITFNASATISGGPITLGSGGITVANGVKGAVITSAIAGSANFTVQGSGMANSEISFKGANTFTGNMTVKGVLLHAYTDQAFGSTSGSTTLYACTTVNDANLLGQIKFHGIDTSEPILHYNYPEKGMAYYFDANTTNILRGKVEGKSGRMNFNAGENAYTVISNSWTGIGNTDSTARPASSVFEVFAPMTWKRFFFIGTWHFHSPIGGSSSGIYGVEVRHEVVMMATNVFDVTNLNKSNVKLWGSGTWNLNGYDQRLDQFFEYSAEGTKSDRTGKVKFTITSAKPAVLYYDNSPLSQDYAGSLTGQVGLTVEGNKTLTLTGASTTIGDLLVTNTVGSGTATLAFSATGSWAGTNITVASGSQLTLNNAINLAEHAKVHVEKGGCVSLTGAYTVHDLYTNGVKVAGNATYGSSDSTAKVKDDDHFTGTGVIAVMEEAVEESIWTGQAADGDLLKTAGNWKDSAPPDLTSGLARPVFAESGTRAVVPEETVRLGQVTLTLPDETPRFAFEPQGEASKVALASLATGESSSVREYTNNVATVLENGQAWNIASANTTFYQNTPISSAFSIDWSKDGAGTLYLMKQADGLTGTFHLLAGNLHLKNPAALGEAKLEITYGSKIYFYGGVISNDIQIIGPNATQVLNYQANTTTEFKGMFDFNSHYERSVYGSNTKVIFSGGVKGCSGWRTKGGHLVFTNKSCSIAAFNGGHPKVEIWTTNNTFGVYYGNPSYESFIFDYGTPVELHAPYAANTNTATANNTSHLVPFITAKAGDSYSIFGNDQQFAHVEEGTIADASSWTITSDKPAQMKIYQNEDKTLSHLLVTGAAGLTLNGPNALTLTGRTCTTTGALEVERGTLTLGAGESFPNVRTVRVSGGTLALTSAGQLDRRVNLYVSGSGKISIPDGVTLEVRRLYVNGVSQKIGDYTEGAVTGGGKLHVPGGAAVILR